MIIVKWKEFIYKFNTFHQHLKNRIKKNKKRNYHREIAKNWTVKKEEEIHMKSSERIQAHV